jgi:putative radical SAM enzyme (TIGR03279 family)
MGLQEKMKVLSIEPTSPLFGYVRPGYEVLSVNGTGIADEIDFRYKITDERVEIVFADPKGERLEFQFDEFSAYEMGITLDDKKVKLCKNDCIFCFIVQQPQGMRRSLYLKDEDFRLSFTHGNFITLSNTTEQDIERIIEQRLSPLYISVHATDDTLRRCMLRNEKLAPIVPTLKQLTENGITVHTQVVLCPNINDGPYLEQTIDQLAALYPNVETLAVVPVGLTKYRDNLAKLRNYRQPEAAAIIDYVEKRQKEFLKEHGTRFVWASDEFYVEAGRSFPSQASYEEMNQFENGIGMGRELITMYNRRKRYLVDITSDRRVLFLTGHSAYPFLKSELFPHITDTLGLQAILEPVDNRFWGAMVTVSGLLTGQDLLRHARSREYDFDAVVLPPNCLNHDDLFLDNLSLQQFQRTLGKPVIVGQYNLAATVKEAFA